MELHLVCVFSFKTYFKRYFLNLYLWATKHTGNSKTICNVLQIREIYNYFFLTEFDFVKKRIDDGVVEEGITSEDEKSEKLRNESLKEGTFIVWKDHFCKSVWNYIFITCFVNLDDISTDTCFELMPSTKTFRKMSNSILVMAFSNRLTVYSVETMVTSYKFSIWLVV